MNMTRDEAERRLSAFLEEQAAYRGVALTVDLDLLDSRVIDSLAFMNFVSLIEQIVGQSLELEQVQLDDLRTVATVRERFFATLPPEGVAPCTP